MITAILGIIVVAFAGACGIAVYRTGRPQPVFRSLVTFGLLLLTPGIAFGLLSVGLTSDLPIVAVSLPLVLLGLGLYVVAEGSFPSFTWSRKSVE